VEFGTGMPPTIRRLAMNGAGGTWPHCVARAGEYFLTEADRHVSRQVLRVDGGDQTWPA
jgi:hypothetical protein